MKKHTIQLLNFLSFIIILWALLMVAAVSCTPPPNQITTDGVSVYGTSTDSLVPTIDALIVNLEDALGFTCDWSKLDLYMCPQDSDCFSRPAQHQRNTIYIPDIRPYTWIWSLSHELTHHALDEQRNNADSHHTQQLYWEASREAAAQTVRSIIAP